ncbi:hypothetical protein [Nonomuraea soli]|uniref:Uncharacterized protein n=1 Tax=Nonomuraea soli TaxID=1032476 RepID=A0A7W0CEL9_9ACTN|nr:hypothetical protein [Nonomuraea soli]MBA2889607.1 hypothetical protein [Nonomuraea soli]
MASGAATGQVAKVGIVAAVALAITALLPWVSIDFLVSTSIAGVRSPEGKFVLLFGVAAVVLAALWLTRRQVAFLYGTAAAGVLAVLTLVIFAARIGSSVEDALPPGGVGDELGRLAREAVGLDFGWYLAMLAALALVGVAAYGWWSSRKERS